MRTGSRRETAFAWPPELRRWRMDMVGLRWTTVPGFCLLGFCLSAHPALAYRAYISNEKVNSVSVIDTDKMETIATVKTGQRPRGIEVSHDGKSVYVAVGDDDLIQVIDTKTLNVVSDLPSGPDPEQFILDPAGKLLYVANENDAMVTVLDVCLLYTSPSPRD